MATLRTTNFISFPMKASSSDVRMNHEPFEQDLLWYWTWHTLWSSPYFQLIFTGTFSYLRVKTLILPRERICVSKKALRSCRKHSFCGLIMQENVYSTWGRFLRVFWAANEGFKLYLSPLILFVYECALIEWKRDFWGFVWTSSKKRSDNLFTSDTMIDVWLTTSSTC